MNQSKKALKWIVSLLKSNKIPFQITGGLAAKAYGAERKLFDIDIYVPEKHMDKVIKKTKNYIVLGPKHSKTKNWDLEYIKIIYAGQRIEIGSPEKTKMFDKEKGRWIRDKVNFSKPEVKEVFGLKVPVIPKKQLISRKVKLGRKVDKIDLRQMGYSIS